jgi:LAO/AO transport system kinase
MPATDQTLAERLLAGDKRALARAISLVENNDPEGWELVREVYPHTGGAAVLGFTGPPGVGKSTLLGGLTKLQRAREQTVAVLSIDPSSPFTQGALLGDRIRLSEHFLDPGVFIRSMASRGALGGLSDLRVGRRSPRLPRRSLPRSHRAPRNGPCARSAGEFAVCFAGPG